MFNCKFKDIANFSYGVMPKKENILTYSKYPIYSGYQNCGFYSQFNTAANTLILIARGVGGTGDIKKTKVDCWLTNLSIRIELTTNKVVADYLYYYFQKNSLRQIISGSAQPQITINDLSNIVLVIPDLVYQQYIVDIIGSIDDKIENNNKIISSIDKLMLLNFRKNYDLANDIKTYKINLKDIIELKTGKKDANASLEKGHYPFFTCSEKDSKIDDYSFDQEAIIIAGNGNMSVKYYKGKFDAYQRTYIIKPNKYTCYLYLFYKTFINDISQGARGSVIKFLTRSMLEEIEVYILNDDKMNEFEIVNIEHLNFIQKLKKENKSLEKTKALYLKKFFD